MRWKRTRATIACPKCGGITGVTDSRERAGGTIVRRRKKCLDCGEKITTVERYSYETLQEVRNELMPIE